MVGELSSKCMSVTYLVGTYTRLLCEQLPIRFRHSISVFRVKSTSLTLTFISFYRLVAVFQNHFSVTGRKIAPD